MSRCLSEGRVKGFGEAKEKRQLISESGDLFVTEAKTKMNERLKKNAVLENVWCSLIK